MIAPYSSAEGVSHVGYLLVGLLVSVFLLICWLSYYNLFYYTYSVASMEVSVEIYRLRAPSPRGGTPNLLDFCGVLTHNYLHKRGIMILG